jgi:preprotein translocase subunit SecY
MIPATLRVLARDWRALGTLGLFAILFRLLVFIPLPVPAADAAALVRNDAYLALFDVFTGGAMGRHGFATLGLMPYLLARVLVRASGGTTASRELRWEERLWPRWAVAPWSAVVAVLMAVVYIAILRRLGADFGDKIGPVAILAGWVTLGAFVPVLACGMLMHVLARLHPQPMSYLTRERRTASGAIGFMLSVNVLAALPEHVVLQMRRDETVTRVLALLLCALLMLLAAQVRREIPINYPKRITAKSNRLLNGESGTLPFAPCSFGYLPWIFAVVVIFGSVAMSSLFMVGSAVPWARELAAIEREMTDPRGWSFWMIFFVWGIVVQLVFWDRRVRSIPEQLRREGGFVPYLRPGRNTMLYLRAVFLKGLVIAAPLNMLLLSTPAIVAFARDDVGTWPMMLLPLVFCGQKVRGAADALRASAVSLSYEGLIRKSRLR